MGSAFLGHHMLCSDWDGVVIPHYGEGIRLDKSFVQQKGLSSQDHRRSNILSKGGLYSRENSGVMRNPHFC